MSQFEPKGAARRKSVALLSIVLMAVGGLGAVWGYEGFSQAQRAQAYLSCNGSQGCDLHVPISMNLKLEINVTNHGKLVSSNTFPHDLILNNFYQWLIKVLDNDPALTAITASLTDTSGTARTPFIWDDNSNAFICSSAAVFNCASSGYGGLIEVGTSTTAAARTDYNIGSAYQGYFDTSSTCSTGSTDSVVVTGSENANSAATITESGLFYQYNNANTQVTIMLAHDVFTGISVSAGNTITVQYTWSLNNAGFNYNLCEFLAGYFTQPNGAGNQIKTPNALMVFYDTSGRNVTWVPLCAATSAIIPFQPLSSSSPTTSACGTWGSSGNAQNAMQIHIGTGSTAFTPTTRALTSNYASNYITNVNYDGAGNAYETANILLSTGATISEAAIYLTLAQGCIGYSPNDNSGAGSCVSGYGTDTIMLLGTTFTGVAVPSGQSIGITFEESG